MSAIETTEVETAESQKQESKNSETTNEANVAPTKTDQVGSESEPINSSTPNGNLTKHDDEDKGNGVEEKASDTEPVSSQPTKEEKMDTSETKPAEEASTTDDSKEEPKVKFKKVELIY
jgi:hypothetical protein